MLKKWDAERWKKEERREKRRRTNGYFPVLVFRFPRSTREFTAEVTLFLVFALFV